MSITMTCDEMTIYDSDDEPAVRILLAGLYARASKIAAETGRNVEIYTADGVLAGCADSSHLN